jgi:Zn-dependent protease with chaperone function/parvulin-like peptidyl-prolyl isomerase
MTHVLAGVVSNAIVAFGLAGVALIVGQLACLQHRPAVRHALWLLVLAKLVTPPLFGISILAAASVTDQVRELTAVDSTAEFKWNDAGGGSPNDSKSMSVESQGTDLGATLSRIRPYRIGWFFELTAWGISLFGTTAILYRVLWEWFHVRRLLRVARPASGLLLDVMGDVSGRMGSRTPRVCLVDGQISPMLWVDPRGALVVLPKRLVERFNVERLRLLLAHEVAHYLRRDHWTNVFAVIVSALFWWHPIVWWARRELRLAQELCCDALVLARLERVRRQYAETLLETLEFMSIERTPLPELASGFGAGQSLQRRFEMLARLDLTHRLAWWSWPCLLAVVCMLPLGVLFAQDSPNQPGRQQRAAGTVVARVNGEEISYKVLADELIARKGTEVLDALISRMLIEQACRERGITITPEELEAEIDSTARRLGLTRDQYLSRLENSRGLKRPQYERDIVWPSVALKKLAKPLVQVTQNEIDQEIQSRFGEKVKCRWVRVDDEQLVMRIWHELRASERDGKIKRADFERQVERHSTDVASRKIGGELPPISRYSRLPLHELAEEAFALKEDGEFSRAIRFDNSWVILFRESRVPSSQKNVVPEDYRRVESELYDGKIRDQSQQIYDSLRKSATIDDLLSGSAHGKL